jgi:two-component system sensor histidine kinase SenX3
MSRRSTVTPLTIGIVLMLLLLTLAVGWQVLVWTDRPDAAPALRLSDWLLLVLGSLFFLVVMVGLVWMCAWLVREMRLNQRQRAFLDAVTHEMKTPLASFRLYLDTLRRHDPDPERRANFLERMRADLDRLEATVGQVLAAARAEEARPTVMSGRVDLVALIRECIREVLDRHQLPGEAVSLESEGVSPVRGDPGELQLVFANLLENAVKYSDDPVEVRVEVAPFKEGRVRVAIADSGIGIPPGELRKIFQRFYRVGRDVQRQVAGLGLGLFVVRNLVRRHGGRVVASSEGAGRGSRFVVTLRTAPGRG